MHAYLITGSTHEKRVEKIHTLLSPWDANRFNLRVLTPPLETPTITITMIREWTRTLSFKASGNSALIGIIHHAEYMTNEAQTALLKTLEEPPGNVRILIESNSSDVLLPTICSRTTHVYLGTDAAKTNEPYPETVGEKLQKSEEVGKTRKGADEYLTSIIHSLHNDFISHPHLHIAHRLKKCLDAVRMLSVNVTPLSVLEETLAK